MPKADRTAAGILAGVVATLAITALGTKIFVVDHYKKTYKLKNHLNNPSTTTSQKQAEEPKIIYDRDCPYLSPDGATLPPNQFSGDIQPSAPPADDDLIASTAVPSAPSADQAYQLGFVNDAPHAHDTIFQMTQQAINAQTWVYADAWADLNKPQQTQSQSSSIYGDAYSGLNQPQSSGVYGDAYSGLNQPQQQPTQPQSLYPDWSAQQIPTQQGQPLYPNPSAQQQLQTPDGIIRPVPQYPPRYQAPGIQTTPPAYQAAPIVPQPQQQSPFGQFVPNVVRFSFSLKNEKGNMVRPLPACRQCPKFKLKDIKWVMFDDGKCRRVKHGFYNRFAMWNGDCLISTFKDDNGRERIIYWTR